MLFLLILPAFTLAATAHHCLRSYAPSNMLIAWLRAAQPNWRTAGALLSTAVLLVAGAHRLDIAIAAGAPAWLNLVVLILTWDAIKLAWLALEVAALSAYRSAAHNRWRKLQRTGDRSARRGSDAAMIAGGGR